MDYTAFLASKITVAEKHGFTISSDELHHSLRPDQKDIVCWCLELGAALVAPDAGSGKTRIGIETMRILQERFGGKCLIVTELGASETFTSQDPEVGEGANLDLYLQYVTSDDEAAASSASIVVTNYERVRMGGFDFSKYTAVWLDEGNYIKNMASKTTDVLRQQLEAVKYKFIATATPSPNEDLELVNYAHALGIADRGQILTAFFKRNSTKAGELSLKEDYQMLSQHRESFWMWVSSWCLAITSPADLGYNFPGFELPKLNLHWIEVPLDEVVEAGVERDGQARMFIESRSGLSEAAKIARSAINPLTRKAKEIVDSFPEDHFILWHHLEDERKTLNRLFKDTPGYGDMYGSQDWEVREKRIIDFTKGDLKILATKPSISGVGCNFQKHCSKCVFVSITDSFNDIYQAIKRIYRFYNPAQEVDVWFLYTPEQYPIVQNIKRKWAAHDSMREKMREIISLYGLDQSKSIEARKRSFFIDRIEYKGDNYELINTDCIDEFRRRADDSIDMFLSSFPFGNHYEYTDKYNDFGHNNSLDRFCIQLRYLLPHMLRTLKPGRIAAIHLKNRIHYGSVTGLGFSTFHRFTHRICDEMEAAGFYCMGFHYIPTDVVAENNQTYRLTFGEMKKDSTKMGAGIPEEVWIFRKAPTSNANAYADVPVVADPDYSLAHWQVDADAFWRSSGNRYLTPRELREWGLDKIAAWWKRYNSENIYDYEQHIELLQSLDAHRKLSRTFTTVPLRSNTPYVWNDVNRMHGLNMEQSRRKLANHICPMPFDEVDRLIELYSNPGDLIADPFGGIGTTGVRAIKKGRRALLTELNETYAKTAAGYLKETELKKSIPTLFDVLQAA